MNEQQLQLILLDPQFWSWLSQQTGQSEEQCQQMVALMLQSGDLQALLQFMQIILQYMQAGALMARFGAKLNYLKTLRGNCPAGSELMYYKAGGRICKKCIKKRKNGGALNPVEEFKSMRCGGKAKKYDLGGPVSELVVKGLSKAARSLGIEDTRFITEAVKNGSWRDVMGALLDYAKSKNVNISKYIDEIFGTSKKEAAERAIRRREAAEQNTLEDYWKGNITGREHNREMRDLGYDSGAMVQEKKGGILKGDSGLDLSLLDDLLRSAAPWATAGDLNKLREHIKNIPFSDNIKDIEGFLDKFRKHPHATNEGINRIKGIIDAIRGKKVNPTIPDYTPNSILDNKYITPLVDKEKLYRRGGRLISRKR